MDPTIVVYPEQVWYGFVQTQDLDEIVEEHLRHGRPVERLRLAPECLNTASCPHRPEASRGIVLTAFSARLGLDWPGEALNVLYSQLDQ